MIDQLRLDGGKGCMVSPVFEGEDQRECTVSIWVPRLANQTLKSWSSNSTWRAELSPQANQENFDD